MKISELLALYETLIQDDSMSLRDWFGKGKHGGAGGGGWDRYNTKGERIGKCGDRKEGEGKPKCLSKARAASLRARGGKKAIAAAVRKKRREDPNPEKRGKAKMVSNRVRGIGEDSANEAWSQKYKKSIDCNNPKGFSQRAHCQGKKKRRSGINEQINSKPKIYLDMDGVLADFIRGYNMVAGTDYNNQWEIPSPKGDPTFEKIVGTDFFSTLQPFSTTDDIVDLALKYGGGAYSICSSPLRNDGENSKKHKTSWIKEHLHVQPEDIVITPTKKKYAVQDGVSNILIDDKPQNIIDWRNAGGYGILYDARVNSTKYVERELEKIFKDEV